MLLCSVQFVAPESEKHDVALPSAVVDIRLFFDLDSCCAEVEWYLRSGDEQAVDDQIIRAVDFERAAVCRRVVDGSGFT